MRLNGSAFTNSNFRANDREWAHFDMEPERGARIDQGFGVDLCAHSTLCGWSNGVMEQWSGGLPSAPFPLLQHSNTPLLQSLTKPPPP